MAEHSPRHHEPIQVVLGHQLRDRNEFIITTSADTSSILILPRFTILKTALSITNPNKNVSVFRDGHYLISVCFAITSLPEKNQEG